MSHSVFKGELHRFAVPLPGLVPDIHAFSATDGTTEDVGGRNKPGHGDLICYAKRHAQQRLRGGGKK